MILLLKNDIGIERRSRCVFNSWTGPNLVKQGVVAVSLRHVRTPLSCASGVRILLQRLGGLSRLLGFSSLDWSGQTKRPQPKPEAIAPKHYKDRDCPRHVPFRSANAKGHLSAPPSPSHGVRHSTWPYVGRNPCQYSPATSHTPYRLARSSGPECRSAKPTLCTERGSWPECRVQRRLQGFD